ncbi:MAG: polymerase factor sigma-54 [Panacagrimonas sp.]|jgi:RNA polymerase sigma-54 factor|nr:RNA polymerase factor sigma-54 [Panacagrimonas sp.]MCC2658098.1 polymerase factor sigma-54 [Panacagrimonas sp.]
MSVSLSLGARQNLSISPRMQQAIRLLQLSALDFELELRNSVMTNPFLEETEEAEAAVTAGAALDGEPDILSVTEASPAADALMEPSAIITDGLEAAALADAQPAVDRAELLGDDGTLPDDFAFERTSNAPANDDEGPQLGWVGETRGLRDHLRQQLYASRRSEREVLAGEIVIETLDDDGYLREDVQASLDKVDVDPPFTDEEIRSAITLVRSFEPTGVGATSLTECLLMQLRAKDGDTPGRELAETILTEHIDVLSRRDFQSLRKRLDCDEDVMREALALIRRLDPDPASRYQAKAPDYVIPDVIVYEQKGKYLVALNPAIRSRARLNKRYVDMFRACRRSQHPQMNQQLQEARWLVRNVEQRFDTILRVANFIVERQREFFDVGDIALKPLVLRDVAVELGLHESTVSRATGNKYMSTPRGCFEFKHFFSRELPCRDGPACSAASVRNLIQGLITNERRSRPLSDVDIAAQLQSQGIRIARRTVTKYRRMLKVPPAEFRKVM